MKLTLWGRELNSEKHCGVAVTKQLHMKASWGHRSCITAWESSNTEKGISKIACYANWRVEQYDTVSLYWWTWSYNIVYSSSIASSEKLKYSKRYKDDLQLWKHTLQQANGILQSIQFPEEKVQQYLDCDIWLPTGKIPDTSSNTQLRQHGFKSKLKMEIK